VLCRQFGADAAFAIAAADVATRSHGQMHTPYPLVSLLVKAGMLTHDGHR
jgi:hypothetical protein